MKHFTSEELTNLPSSESVRLINFETAQVNGGFIPNTFFLTASGEKPYLNMIVELSPVIYVQQPDYWRIEVVGILPGFGLPVIAPYVKTMSLDGVIGKKGIEVVGANKSEKFDIVGDNTELCNQIGDVSYRANQVPGGVIIIADGKHETSGYDVFFELSPLDIFPPQFILTHRKPDGIIIQRETPFNCSTSIKVEEKIDEIIIHDAKGQHTIEVEQTPE